MKFIKNRKLEKFLVTDDEKVLKKILGVKKEEDYFKCLLEYLEKSVNNYDDMYINFIYKLIELIKFEIKKDVSSLEKFNMVIRCRSSFFRLNHVLYKKTRHINDPYSSLKDLVGFIDDFDVFLGDEVTNTSIKTMEFSDVLEFLDRLLSRDNVTNLDIINKLLSSLEYVSKSDVSNVLDKANALEEFKAKVKDKINEKSNLYKQEKNNLNNLNFIYHRVDKTLGNIFNNLNKNSDSVNDDFDSLFKQLLILAQDLSDRNVSSIYKILKLIDDKVISGDISDYVNVHKGILRLIDDIHGYLSIRVSHSDSYYLNDIINRLRSLDDSVISSVEDSEINDINNMIKNVMFDARDISCVDSLIRDNYHLISIYDSTFGNLVDEVFDCLVKEISNKNVSYESVGYFNKVFDLFLSSNLVDSDKREDLLLKIEYMYQDVLKSGKGNDFICSWYEDIAFRINDCEDARTEDSINKMYNIVVPKYKKINYKPRKDNSNEFIVTIDEDRDVNKDDAISVSRIGNDLYNLRVYISDPLSVFNINSYPIKCARNNCETIYLRDNSIEMFNPKVIKKYLSLDEGKVRNVKVYSFILDSSGKLVNFEIKKECPRVSRNYTYDEFNQLLNKSYSLREEKLVDNLDIINKLFYDKDINFKGFNVLNAEQLVSIIMIYTNSKVAEYFAKEGYPFIYRHYDDKKCKVLSDFDSDYSKYLALEGSKSNNALYSVDSKNHDALGLGYYSHLTSPNRRYADILANHCIDKFYFEDGLGVDIKDFEEYLKRETDYLNDRLVGINNYYEDYTKHVLVRKK